MSGLHAVTPAPAQSVRPARPWASVWFCVCRGRVVPGRPRPNVAVAGLLRSVAVRILDTAVRTRRLRCQWSLEMGVDPAAVDPAVEQRGLRMERQPGYELVLGNLWLVPLLYRPVDQLACDQTESQHHDQSHRTDRLRSRSRREPHRPIDFSGQHQKAMVAVVLFAVQVPPVAWRFGSSGVDVCSWRPAFDAQLSAG